MASMTAPISGISCQACFSRLFPATSPKPPQNQADNHAGAQDTEGGEEMGVAPSKCYHENFYCGQVVKG